VSPAVAVAGAGMAGLVVAVRLRELGRDAVVLERGTRPGGSMLLSSCVVWRHGTAAEFLEECPGGDAQLQRAIVEELDDAIEWLRSLGAPVVAEQTGNPRTVGVRLDPRGLTKVLARRAGEVRLGASLDGVDGPVILATGGFGVRLAAEHRLLLRAAPWSDGGGIAYGRARGAALSTGLDEFFGRALPAPPARVGEKDFVRAAQLYARFAHVVDELGRPVLDREPSWSETDVVQTIASLPGARAWYVLDGRAVCERARERTVAEMVAVAEELGGEVRRGRSSEALGLGPLVSPKLAEPPFAAVHVQASVTHTIGGLRVDSQTRVLDESGAPLPGLWACGADAGGIFVGGYGSGLAAALVLGLRAAESAAGDL